MASTQSVSGVPKTIDWAEEGVIEWSALGGDLVSGYMPSILVPQKPEAGRICKLQANLGHKALPSLGLDARLKGRDHEPRNVVPPEAGRDEGRLLSMVKKQCPLLES